MAPSALERLDALIDAMPPEGDAQRDEWEARMADAMRAAYVRHRRGWVRCPVLRATPVAGRERDARRWVEGVLRQPWPVTGAASALGRMIERLYQRGDSPPPGLFEIDASFGVRPSQYSATDAR